MKASAGEQKPAPAKPAAGKPAVIGKAPVPTPRVPSPVAPRAAISDNPADVMKRFEHLETPAQVLAAMNGDPMPPRGAPGVTGSAHPRASVQARPEPQPRVNLPGVVAKGDRTPAPTMHKHVEEELDGYGLITITDTGRSVHTLRARMKLAIRMRDAAVSKLLRTNNQAFITSEFEKDGYDGPWFACFPSSVTFKVEAEEGSNEQPEA